MPENDKIKIAGYARRIFFNDNIEYRNFSPDLVGLQLTSEGGTTLFTNGNFSIDVNLDPKPDVVFKQGTKSKLFCLDDIVINPTEQTIQKNIKTNLNLDLTNPLTYVWYGSGKELIRSSLIQAQENFPAAIYVDDKVGSVTGNNITNYVYDISTDESTFTVNSRFFVNPYNIRYTLDSQYTPTDDTSNKLRNFTVNHTSYVIEHNGISKPIISITPATQQTNSDLELVVKGNPFPELTGIYIPTLSFLFTNVDASIPYFIKPNEVEIEGFFTSLNDFQKNILSRETNPPYNSIIISTEVTDDGLILTTKSTLEFPVLEDGYNLNFFDTFYLTYLSKLTEIGEDLDESSTDIIIRKYTTEAINSFDTLPSQGDDLTLNGEKATKLLRIYGVEFDHVKKFINGIKFAHTVTYDKKNNIPDTLVKDLSHMLGLDPITFVTSTKFNKLLLPSNGAGEFSGTSVNYTQDQIDIELYRRLILNIAWLWKSKGTRKSIEFLFRFIGAPEALVNFNEYIVMVDKPLDMDKIKELLYIYTGDVTEADLQNIPYDSNGYPLPPINGQLVINDFIDPETGEIVENEYTDMYFQKGGGWYRDTFGGDGLTVLRGNNPHVGPYDGGNEYLQYFSRCYIPNFNSEPTISVTSNTITQNYFINYNYGIFNGIPTGTTEFFTKQITYNSITNGYQPMDECVNVNYSIIETPLQNDGLTTIQQAFVVAEQEYLSFQTQIQQDNYLAYSPEWQTIQTNYQLAQNNVSSEIATEECGVDANNTLQICIEELVSDILPFNCDTLKAVTDCSPFLYYVDPTNGQKVSFDEFSQCCSEYKNGEYEYVSYINAAGRKSEYCSALAPCVGEIGTVLPNGIVEFTAGGNNTAGLYASSEVKSYEEGVFNHSAVHQFIDETGKVICVQFFGRLDQFFNEVKKVLLVASYESFYSKFLAGNVGLEEFFDAYADEFSSSEIYSLIQEYFREVDCKETSVISSPECCAWHNLDYAVIQSEVDGNQYVVCVKNDNTVNELVSTSASENYTIPPTDSSSSLTTYNEFQNPIGEVVSFYSTKIYKDCFNKSLIVTGTGPNVSNLNPSTNALFLSATLNTPSYWEVSTIDQYGRVSFTPVDPLYDFILDWNAQDELGLLYETVANYYGYSLGTFILGCGNILTPYYGGTSTSNVVTTAAVDPSRIGCDDINNVSVVFGSESWQGFKLPENSECSCSIDFSFDYMLKYEAENLMECVKKDPCYPTIFNEVSLNNIDCRNFIVFTSNEEDSSDPNSLINNFNSNSTSGEEFLIWQNNNCIINPPTDCCTSIGGNVTSTLQWEQSNDLWVSNVNQQYQTLLNGGSLSQGSSQYKVGMLTYIDEYTTTLNSLNDLLSGCYTLPTPVPSECNIQYGEYIKTSSVCSLDVPLECGIWTKTLTDYRNLIDSVNSAIIQYSGLCDVGEIIVNSPATTTPNNPYENSKNKSIQITKSKNKLQSELNNELKILTSEKGGLDVKIAGINSEIESKESDIIVIKQATTKVSTNIDCGIYENKISEINDFNYKSFCSPFTSTKQYNKCVSTQRVINEDQKLIYEELLNNCKLNNNLQLQLTNAKFENNTVLINTLNKEIFETQSRINILTQKGVKFISTDTAQETSALEINNTINTTNRTAELLNKTTAEITDQNGVLVLTTADKITLKILMTQYQSKVASLTAERSELQVLLNNNVTKSVQITKSKKRGNPYGDNLFSWGVGLIGTGLFLNELLDPEIITGVVNAAIWTMPHQLFKALGDDSGVKDDGTGAVDVEMCKFPNLGYHGWCPYSIQNTACDDGLNQLGLSENGIQLVYGFRNTGGNSTIQDTSLFTYKMCTDFEYDIVTNNYVNWIPDSAYGSNLYTNGCCLATRIVCELGNTYCRGNADVGFQTQAQNSNGDGDGEGVFNVFVPPDDTTGGSDNPCDYYFNYNGGVAGFYQVLNGNQTNTALPAECCTFEVTGYPVFFAPPDTANNDKGLCTFGQVTHRCSLGNIPIATYQSASPTTPPSVFNVGGFDYAGYELNPDGSEYILINPEYGNVITEGAVPDPNSGVILYDGLDGNLAPLPAECCTSESVGYDVAPYIMAIQQTNESGQYNYQYTYFGCFPIVPEVIDNPPTPIEGCTTQFNDLGVLATNYNSQATVDDGSCNYPPPDEIPIPDPCCDNDIIVALVDVLEELQSKVLEIEIETKACYDGWLNTLNNNYHKFLEVEQNNFLKYIDDLKINFKLFVNNTNVDTNTNIDTDLTYLPYTQSINPIWEWDPTQQYSGLVLSGSEINISTIEDAIFESLSSQNINFSSDMFQPNWSTLNFTIPECVCDDLRRLYPNKEFFFSIELENYECSLCLLVDNIFVNVTDCNTDRLVSLNECLIPQLSCVIDNKKSWVYTDQGVVTKTIYPEGECNTMSTSNYEITKLTTPKDRLWLDLEYRYTNYEVNHSDLILNVKNASFSIDPAKAIECDVYDFWKSIDCDNCPTSCTTGDTITFSGQVYTSTTLGNYTLDVSASTSGILFSCDTYTSILTDQVLELKNDYYSLTSDYNESLDANYNDLLNKGGSLSKFYIQKNNCGSDTIVINNNNNLDNLFGLITEDSDGTLSFYESYIYSGTTPYVGGVLTEVISGITAQTFNQTSGVTSECCTSLNGLINDKGTLGLGIEKNYIWDTTTNSCNWKEINSCNGDCEYYGTKKVFSSDYCSCGAPQDCECCTETPSGISTVGVCVNPLDYLDTTPSQIITKDNFDTMVLSNLIDVKSRQTISDYPTLRLFYQLYLAASNCGEELSGKLTYNNLFEFMDKIGDYWLDLLEQVVPATTIWEGCDNSGKIFRNTIFDQNKFNYKKYSLNIIPEVQNNCPVSGITDFSIGEQDVYAVLEVIPIYPTNNEIIQTKNNILTTRVEISDTQQLITTLTTQVCALNLQDDDSSNVNVQSVFLNNQISNLNQTLVTQQTTLSDLLIQLEQQQTEYLLQQSDYYSKYMSCSGLTESLVNAQNNLSSFIPGTTNYERQRNFIANIRNELTKCIRKSSLLLTNEDSFAFITQIYDTNEYEGNVLISGDNDWSDEGPFYNTELIHNCDTTVVPPTVQCNIINIVAGAQTVCDPDTYTQEVTVTYNGNPETGVLIINGQSFTITSSPQTETLIGLIGDGNSVDVTAAFSIDKCCTLRVCDLFTAPLCTKQFQNNINFDFQDGVEYDFN
jgi:hypothetical protein